MSKDTEKFGILVSQHTEMWARAAHLSSSLTFRRWRYKRRVEDFVFHFPVGTPCASIIFCIRRRKLRAVLSMDPSASKSFRTFSNLFHHFWRLGLGLLGRHFLDFTIKFYCDPVLIEAHMLDGTRTVEHFQSAAASIFSLPAEFNSAAA